MKKPILIISISSLISVSASAATLIAGWDAFNTVANATPTHLGSATTATLTSSATSGGWDDWNNNTLGASDDGTFGSLSNAVATATTSVGTGSNQGTNLSLNRIARNGVLTITLTNTSGDDRVMDGFYFDAVHRFAESADTWSLSFSGAISGTSAGGALSQVSSMSAATAVQRDKFVDLSGLTDNVWEAGQNAIFTLTFTGSTGTLSGGGQETMVDNIGITVIPEPSAFALFAFGLTGLLVRRRK